ncbi:Esterase CM06B1 [Aphelenchoides fujianensis]|nr:Esterase CM06B1 [Aphelenchoides fujianensis]
MSRPSRIVQTNSGPVRGKTFEFADKPPASAFLGIPYAQPPVGELRFKSAETAARKAMDRSEGVFEQFTPACPQIKHRTLQEVIGDEDCLYLNVFTPENTLPPSPKLPVLFYIHGGCFLMDTAESIGDEGICRLSDIVVVSINYRLGIFGFLSLNNEECAGNFGLWDMTLGPPLGPREHRGRITIAGQSAGAVAVDLLTLSPHSRDLFAQGILVSRHHLRALESRKTLVEWAKYRGCTVERDERERSERRRSSSSSATSRPTALAVGVLLDANFTYAPHNFLPLWTATSSRNPSKELRKEAPRKAFVNGVTEYEGLGMFKGKFNYPDLSSEQFMAKMLRFVRPTIPEQLAADLVARSDGRLQAARRNTRARPTSVLSDFLHNHGAHRFGVERTKLGDRVYNFVFTHYKKGTSWGPATHCTELPFFFGKSILGDFEVEAEDEPVIERFTTDPNNEKYAAKWLPVDAEHPGRHFVFAT